MANGNRLRPLHRSPSADLMHALDALWSQAVKLRDGHRCRYCGKTKRQVVLDPHHIFGRGRKSVRWNIANGITLCRAHHNWVEQHPADGTRWIQEQIGLDAWDALVLASNQIIYSISLPWLEERQAEIKAALQQIQQARELT